MAIQITASEPIPVGDTETVAVDYSAWLDGAELLSGTPSAVEQTTSDLTITGVTRNTAAVTINNKSVGINRVVLLTVAGGVVANSPYTIRVTVSTDASRTIIRDLLLEFSDDPSNPLGVVTSLTPLANVYTSQDEIDRLFSTVGVSLRTDDLESIDLTAYWTELTEEVTETINQYAEMYYAPADLVTSRWVRSRATWLGAHYLSMRRGNPALFLARYEDIITDLENVALGNVIIPSLPTRADMTPTMSNLIVDERFVVKKLRVHPVISAGGNDSRQDPAYIYPYEWL